MANRTRILVDLVVVAAFERLVAEEVDLVVLDTIRELCICFYMLQAVGFVPACRKDVE